MIYLPHLHFYIYLEKLHKTVPYDFLDFNGSFVRVVQESVISIGIIKTINMSRFIKKEPLYLRVTSYFYSYLDTLQRNKYVRFLHNGLMDSSELQ